MSEEEITFMGCPSEINETYDFVILGVPYDGNSTQKRGKTFNSPKLIRIISKLISYASENGDDFNIIKFGDMGDVKISKIASQKKMEKKVTKLISEIYQKNPKVIPVIIGGNHFVTYPVFSSIRSFFSTEIVFFICFDAHLDFFDNWNSKKFTHCTVTKRIFELENMGIDCVFVLGARDIDLPELKLAQKNHLNYRTVKQFYDEKSGNNQNFSQFIQKFLKNRIFQSKVDTEKFKAYISFDIDVFDPAVAPATAYPIPGGIAYRELYQCLEYLTKQFEIIGFDVVEYAPNLDTKSRITGFLAAKLISEFMMMIKKSKIDKEV